MSKVYTISQKECEVRGLRRAEDDESHVNSAIAKETACCELISNCIFV